ncbi:MAG TPA: hypothetical protein VKE69_15145, partial [Planctomycetota bacterium]|nr:hypothetical protein [Planctomycetota bacterium]
MTAADLVASLAAPLLAAAFASPQSQPAPPAESILAKLEAAAGPAAARAAKKNLVMTGKLAVQGMPADASFEDLYAGADRVKLTVTMAGYGSATQGTTGEFSWSTDPAMGIMVRRGDEQGSVVRLYGAFRRAPWSTLYERAEVAGRADRGGRSCWELRMVPKSGKTETWFVDAETSALAAVATELPNPTGGTFPMDVEFSDYRPVDGILYPHVRVEKAGMYTLTYTATSITHPDEIAADRVAPPADVLAAAKDPKKAARRAPDKPGECALDTLAAQPVVTIR